MLMHHTLECVKSR